MVNKSDDKQVKDSLEQVNKNGDRRGMHPNSLKNLKPNAAWGDKSEGTGESGNPQGQSITARQKEWMSETCPFDGQARPWLDALAEGGMRQALTIPVALSNLQDRHEGKVTISIGGEGGEPIKTEIIVSSETAKNLTNAILNGKRT